MCVVSMIMEHYGEQWRRQYFPVWPVPQPYIIPVPSPVRPEEIEEFRRLLDRAREYDRRHNEPDCELEDKKRQIKELAEKLGVDVSFLDQHP